MEDKYDLEEKTAISYAPISFSALLRERILMDLRHLEDCMSEMYGALEERLNAFEKDVEKRAEGMPKSESENWYECNSDRHWKLSEVFPKVLRQSFFVTCYSYLEHILNELCRAFARDVPKTIELKDLRGDGIDRARNYLKKAHGVSFPDQSPEWNRLCEFRRIRNCIVHDNGRVRDKNNGGKAIRIFVRQNPNFASIDDTNCIWLGPKTCTDMIETIRRFMDQLFSEFSVKKGK